MLEAGGSRRFASANAIEGMIVGVEDVDLVVAIRLGEEDAEIGVDEIEIDGLVGDLDD